MKIRSLKVEDIEQTAEVHKAAFIRQGQSLEWIECNNKAFPRVQYFVAEDNNEIIGYIHWNQKSGFRPEVVLELEQLAVHPKKHGNGVATRLINESLPMVAAQLDKRGAKIKHILVTTRADNYAQELYRKTLGAEIETTISDLFSADEVFMIVRNIKL
ncbi:MAG: GNAT family N-acetyltransferase [Desulfobacterales bacterium]|nr:GNAT family N-acetyltransferase [Desulfobacterales bacterium]